MKSECPTYLKSKGKAMAVTLNDDEVSDDESGCDEDGNFINFTTTAVVRDGPRKGPKGVRAPPGPKKI